MRDRMLMAWERLHSIWYTPLVELTLMDLALFVAVIYLATCTGRFIGFLSTDRETAPGLLFIAVLIVFGWIGRAMAGRDGAVYGGLTGIILGLALMFMVERRQRRKDG